MPLYIETFNSNTTWVCPTGVTKVDVECWGGGASQTGLIGSPTKGGHPGGGGGAYSYTSSYSVTSGSGYSVVVGTGGVTATPDGGPSYFANTGVVLAVGGSASNDQLTYGSGGLAIHCTGNIKYNGGFGGISNPSKEYLGGGGGSAAGAYSIGNNGANDMGLSLPNLGGIAPSGNPPRRGGNGGTGGDGTSATNGLAPGGGGGGNVIGSGFTSGAAGRVNIFYWSGQSSNYHYDFRQYISRRRSANGC